MVKKAIDARIPALIRNGIQEKQRSFIILVGDKSRNQLPNLHYLMSSADIRMNKSVVWAYKKKLMGFTSNRKKREAKIKKDVKRGIREANSEDPFELFVSLQNIRYVFYKETEKILGNTYGMCILQDFEAVTPNILARTIETVEGGGLVVILLKSMSSLKQLYTMTMDIHSRYRTEAHDDVVARFNERFILSLGACSNCLVVDDELNVLPISGARNVKALPPPEDGANLSPEQIELKNLKEELKDSPDTKSLSSLVDLTKTLDQAKAVMGFVNTIGEKSLRSTVSLTAGRGRGKSAALGLAIASAVAHGYANIFITSPSPENLKTLFEFIFKGFDALGYDEHMDYDIIQSTNPDFNKAIVRVNIFKSHRQTIQYIQPSDAHVLGQAELVVIDEAAAIPLPLVKALMGPYLVFMASTINGYEGTGRSLSLKLIQQLRQQSVAVGTGGASLGRNLKEITLDEPIRYAKGDPVEKWLNTLLCLDASIAPSKRTAFPHPSECQLFSVNRDSLFSFHAVSEAFLHKIWALYVASHYKNSPNDLQLLSDAPAHQLFVLLSPTADSENKIPEPLCVVQLALEGKISKQSIMSSLASGKRGGGDLIPWVVSQQFQDEEFAQLSGARVIRIATNPEYAGMGYGTRALELIRDFYQGKFVSLSESKARPQLKRVDDDSIENAVLQTDVIKARDAASLPPLFEKLTDLRPESIDYLGVSYGLTPSLHKFWKRNGFVPVYLRQTTNDLTGEHTCVMLNTLKEEGDGWLTEFANDFHKRFLSLLAYEFSKFPATLALSILEAAQRNKKTEDLSREKLDEYFSPYDIKRLESYANNRIDYHVIVDLLPVVANLILGGRMKLQITGVQLAILLGIGLQKKSVEDMSKELNLPVSQTLAMFSKITRKIVNHFREILSSSISATLPEAEDEGLKDMGDLDEIEHDVQEVEEVAEEIEEESLDEEEVKRREKERELINALDMNRYAIADDSGWDASDLKNAVKGSGKVAVKSTSEKRKTSSKEILEQEMKEKKPKKHRKH